MPEWRVVIVADDLTGALDAAAPFAGRGARTRVVVSPTDLAAVLDDVGDCEVLAVNTETRHAPVAEAAARVAEVFNAVKALSPALVIKKIDSTLRGHVVAESLAARRVLGYPLIVAPAVPSQGRTVRHGRVQVHGRALAESDFARDARSAPPDGALPELFAAAGLAVACRSVEDARLAGDIVWDAEDEAALDALVDALETAPAPGLLVGAAGLCQALARRHFRGQGPTPAPGDTWLLVVGSRCEQARRQMAQLAECPVVWREAEAPADRAPPAGWQGTTLLRPGRVGREWTADDVARVLAVQAQAWLARAASPPWLFLTGGDTAMALLRHRGVRSIEVAGEWEPGVAWGWLEGERRQPVVTKAGGFGDDDLLVRLLAASTTRG
ncbi:four-carbon acid sugar kinase family protein [Modicisalibacter tunisiensis]|uniref:Four-carbon acid sugar kinase family protein n=1 Tax=Modicisalibacter tunisiensis TaxID=390637 RepID=A0ABS7X4N7_9GAMM|nr:four-carbon acid sugar kinase family protein [Modicisalibacter tunisiensis]MBZ9568987.1 four-carbon acid sugar kinase family protein [Modicisalibacter tunisiensis]